MSSLYRVFCASLIVCLANISVGSCPAQGSSNESTLAGSVEDPSGARVPHALIQVQSARSPASTVAAAPFTNAPFLRSDTHTDSVGGFTLQLPAGTYAVTISAPGFRCIDRQVTLPASATVNLDVRFLIASRAEEVAVPADSGAETSLEENKTALVLRSAELSTFSDEDATFQNEVLALAGMFGVPPEIYIDGFSGGRFPPKNTIRSVRINRNPYSAQYDVLGLSRVEIDTLPGSQQLHGSLAGSGTDAALNAPDPLIPSPQPPYYIFTFNGSLGGPLDRNTSFFVAANANDQQNNAAVNALTPASLSESVPNPQNLQTYSARLDRQITPTNTLIGRYEFNRNALSNGGVGLLVLPEAGYNSTSTTQTLQLSDEQILGAHTINQSRAEYIRTRLNQTPLNLPNVESNTCPIPHCSILVEGAFTGGGNASQLLHDHQDHLEFQDLLSVDYKSHFLRAGFRYRLQREASLSTANFNGQFIFSDLASYQAASPTLFTLTQGVPSAAISTGDLGMYIEDEWRARSNLTINYGFRFESQTAIPDHVDPAPRAGISWAISRRGARVPLVVLRGGAGIFYDRFTPANLLTTVRQNGILQQTVQLEGSQAAAVYAGGAYSTVAPTTYSLSPNLRSQYDMIAGLSAEHSFGRHGTVGVNYLAARGLHQYLSRDINAPEPGTYNPANPLSGVRPLGGTSNVYQFASDGIEKAQLVYFNTRLNLSSRITVFASWVINHKNTDVAGATAFPSNQYNLSQDFGRETGSQRQTLFSGGQLRLPYAFIGDVFFSAQSGLPYNITTGTDLNGDAQYNDRPYLLPSSLANGSTIKTIPGCATFAQPGSQPANAQLTPFNACTAAHFFYLQLSLARSFDVGPRSQPVAATATTPAQPARRPYNLSFSVEADNILNHTNPGLPVGVLNSPLFGKPLSLNTVFSTNTASNRVINLRSTFRF
jgi:hypothetical protein